MGSAIWVLVDRWVMWHLQMAKSPCNLSSPGFAAMLSAAVNSSSMREDGQHSAEQAREALQDTLRGLPANKQIDLRVLKEAYDSSIREACAADAAVAAVAKVCPRELTRSVHPRPFSGVIPKRVQVDCCYTTSLVAYSSWHYQRHLGKAHACDRRRCSEPRLT